MLSKAAFEKIDREIEKYPPGQSRAAVMAALRIAQSEQGCLSEKIISCVARYLKMPDIAAYEVATFYTMYNIKPVGRHKITVCTNLPCALRGAMKAVAYLEKKLNIGLGETTTDGQFTLCQGECFGACGEAPVFLHNNHKMKCLMTSDKIDRWLSEIC